jgi:heme-degrading monooxygenase HmoA
VSHINVCQVIYKKKEIDMSSTQYHLAQVNIARMLAPRDDPLMAEFVARLDQINALADGSPGFIWRLQTEEGNATSVQAYDDERILVNMSVWESLEHLKAYVYKSGHAQVMRRRHEWFEKFEGLYLALWWIRAGHRPTVTEAQGRLEYLSQHGASAHAFTFSQPFPPPDVSPERFTVTSFDPCPAA